MLFYLLVTENNFFPFFFFSRSRIKCFSSSKTFLTLRRWGTPAWRAWLRTWRSCWCGTRSCCWPTWGQTRWDTSGPVSAATGPSWPLGSWKQKCSKLNTPGKWQGVHMGVLFSTLSSSAGAPVAVAEHLGMRRVAKYGKGLREVKCTSVRRTGECVTVYT